MATCHVHYKPGQDVTVEAGAAITGNRFLIQSADWTDGEPLTATHAGADARPLGISGHDIAVGEVGHMVRRGHVCSVEAGATLARGAAVYVGAAGVAAATGTIIVGEVLRGGVSGDSILIDFYASPLA